MSINKIKEAITLIIENLKVIRDELEITMEYPQTEAEAATIPKAMSLELLAKKLAYSYETFHPEYNADKQFANIKEMVNNYKLKYLVGWMRKRNIEGIEEFFKVSDDAKREFLNAALSKYEDRIKEVLTKRFTK